MSGTLKDKILEFRVLHDEKTLSDIMQHEKRMQIGIETKKTHLQRYFNEKLQQGLEKFGATNLNDRRMVECDYYNKLKREKALELIPTEEQQTEELLAHELQTLKDDRETEYKSRLLFRDSEPELRDLAASVKQRIHGNMLATQIENRRRKHYLDMARERAIDICSVRADLLAGAADFEKVNAKSAALRDAMKQALDEERTNTRAKALVRKQEKEDSKRLIDELVMEENTKIAKEAETKQKIRERMVADYHKFIAEHALDKSRKLDQDRNLEERLLQERNRLYERDQAVERKKKEKIQSRIELQERMGEYTSVLQQAVDKQKSAYLEASERLARAQVGLAELDHGKTREGQKKLLGGQLKAELKQLENAHQKQNEKELNYERELDKKNMEALKREFEERDTKMRVQKEKFQREIREQLEQRQRLLNEEQQRIKRDKMEELASMKAHRDRIQAEREAMLAEYEQYMKYWTACKDSQNKEDPSDFKLLSDDCV